MELLLNLAWLLLALPAYWLWRETRASERCTSTQCLFALACALVLLFPVVSVTDDLHAMQAEMEESSTNKRGVRQAASDKVSLWNSWGQNPPAGIQTSGILFAPGPQVWRELRSISVILPATAKQLLASRGPPSPFPV